MLKIRKNGVLYLGFLLILGFMTSATDSVMAGAAVRSGRGRNNDDGGRQEIAKYRKIDSHYFQHTPHKALDSNIHRFDRTHTKPEVVEKSAVAMSADQDSIRELIKSMVKEDNYETFVEKLGANINDPKFKAALEAGNKSGDKVEFDLNAAFTVGQLVPTQSEIDVDKSLKYPLVKEKPEILRKYLAAELDSEETFAPGGAIITAGARYVIDGHHRWSQLFLINPKIKIKAVNMGVFNPQNALKFTQMAIASVTGKIPVEKVEGKNLFTMSKDDFVTWVKSQKIPNNILAVFKEFGIEGVDAIIEHVWRNAEAMRVHNAPIQHASSRNLMPQTDTARGWVEILEAGKINRN